MHAHHAFAYMDVEVFVSLKDIAAGLQVLDVTSNQWVYPEEMMRDDEYIVFCGQTLSYVSNTYYRPIWHRVVMEEANARDDKAGMGTSSINRASAPHQKPDRHSMPFFLRFQPHTTLEPLGDGRNVPSTVMATEARNAWRKKLRFADLRSVRAIFMIGKYVASKNFW